MVNLSPSSAASQLTDEARLIELLDQAHELRERMTAAPNLAQLQSQLTNLEKQALALADQIFRRNIKPIMTSLFGPQVSSPKGDASLRYSAMKNDVFISIMENRHDEFWRARTVKDLCKWFSVVLANRMRDYLRRRKRGAEILEEEIAPLVVERQRHFHKRSGLDLDEQVLNTLERWRNDPVGETALMGWVLTHRYIDGMAYDEIADQLGIEVSTAYRLRDRGIEILKRQFGDRS